MTLENAIDDLADIAETIARESVLCEKLSIAVQGQWSDEQALLTAITFAGGIAQIHHLERALWIETLEAEIAAENAPRRYAGGCTPGAS